MQLLTGIPGHFSILQIFVQVARGKINQENITSPNLILPQLTEPTYHSLKLSKKKNFSKTTEIDKNLSKQMFS